MKGFKTMPLSQLRLEFDEMMAAEIAKGLVGFSFTDRAHFEETDDSDYELERKRLIGILSMHTNWIEGNGEVLFTAHPNRKAEDVTDTIR